MSADEIESQRARLKRYYTYYAPEKTADDIEKAISRFGPTKEGFDKMYDTLSQKYGPEDIAIKALAANPNARHVPAAGAATAAQSPPPAAAATATQPPAAAAATVAGPSSPPPAAAAPATTAPAPSQQPQANGGVVEVNRDTVKKRLRRFYDHYCPNAKTDADIETSLGMFDNGRNGGYDAMFAKLEHKYGKEADIPVTATIDLTPEEQQYATRLTQFYAFYGIARTDVDIKTALLKFRGQQGGFEKMMKKVAEKYGPEPTAEQIEQAKQQKAAGGAAAVPGMPAAASTSGVNPEDPSRLTFDAALEWPAAKLRRFYATHAPSKEDDEIFEAIKKFESSGGGVGGLWIKLSEKYGAMPLPPPGYAHTWARLRVFFNTYQPATKNSEIDFMLAKAYCTPTGVSDMWTKLTSKYGPEPLDPDIERGMRGPTFLTSRSLGDPPSIAMSVAMRDDQSSWLRKSRALLAPAAGGASTAARSLPSGLSGLGNNSSGNGDATAPEVVRLVVQFTGIDAYSLEDLPLLQRRAIANALEQQVALNAGLQARNVSLIDYHGADAEFEIAAAQGQDSMLFHAAAAIVNKATRGGFNVKTLREVYMRECRTSALHIHAISARVVKPGAKGAGSQPPIVTDPGSVIKESNNAPQVPKLNISEEEARAIKVADEVSRMTEQSRTQYSWKKALEERLQGKSGTSLSFKRNNESFKEFMSNIWADTASAFSHSSPPGRTQTENPLPPRK